MVVVLQQEQAAGGNKQCETRTKVVAKAGLWLYNGQRQYSNVWLHHGGVRTAEPGTGKINNASVREICTKRGGGARNRHRLNQPNYNNGTGCYPAVKGSQHEPMAER